MFERLTGLFGITTLNHEPYFNGMIDGYRVSAKVVENPTPTGINGGRVIKLTVQDDDEIVVHYDRGIDTHEIPLATVKRIVNRLEEIM